MPETLVVYTGTEKDEGTIRCLHHQGKSWSHINDELLPTVRAWCRVRADRVAGASVEYRHGVARILIGSCEPFDYQVDGQIHLLEHSLAVLGWVHSCRIQWAEVLFPKAAAEPIDEPAVLPFPPPASIPTPVESWSPAAAI